MTAIVGWTNYVKTGASIAGSSAAGLGAGNLQDDNGSPSVAWQTAGGVTTAAGGAAITIWPPGTALPWRAFGVFRTNLTASAAITVSLYDGSGTLVYQGVFSGLSAGSGQIVGVLPAAVIADYCTIGIDNGGNPDGFLNIPLAFAGDVWAPLSGVSWNTTAGRDSAVQEAQSRGGQDFPTLQWQRRRWDIEFAGIRAAELWARVGDLDRSARAGGNVLFVPETTSVNIQSEATLGRLTSLSDVSYPHMAGDRRAWRARVSERV